LISLNPVFRDVRIAYNSIRKLDSMNHDVSYLMSALSNGTNCTASLIHLRPLPLKFVPLWETLNVMHHDLIKFSLNSFYGAVSLIFFKVSFIMLIECDEQVSMREWRVLL